MNVDAPSSSIVGLLQNLRDETTRLMRQEVALAKAEVSEKVARATRQGAKVAVAGFIAYAGAILLLFSLGDLIAYLLMQADVGEELARWIGRAVVGLSVIIVGYAMFTSAKKVLTDGSLTPQQTVESLQDNKQWAQAKLSNSHGQPNQHS